MSNGPVPSPQPALPYPDGWFALAMSSEIKPDTVLTRRLAGRDVVLFRDASGRVAAVGPYCAHMGAHLGHGGVIIDGTLACPFHGFRYDGRGRCAGVYYDTEPPAEARLDTHPVHEVNDIVLVYGSADGSAPSWRVPRLDVQRWTAPIHDSREVATHPQETSENSVDLGHFELVHGYDSVETLSEVHTDGPYLRTRYAMTRSAGIFGRKKLRAEFDVHVHGLGYSQVDARVPAYDLDTRLFILATPIAPARTRMTVAVSLSKDSRPSRVNPLLALLPRNLAQHLLQRLALEGLMHDVGQDFDIWEHKTYRPEPLVIDGDGPIPTYRRWARQFYPDEETWRPHLSTVASAP